MSDPHFVRAGITMFQKSVVQRCEKFAEFLRIVNDDRDQKITRKSTEKTSFSKAEAKIQALHYLWQVRNEKEKKIYVLLSQISRFLWLQLSRQCQ